MTSDIVGPMRIAITADPELPVPPKLYGGIERIVDVLVRGLLALGHEVTIFAHPESTTQARLISYPGRSSRSSWDTVRNTAAIAHHLRNYNYDIVHSFSRIAYLLPVLPLRIAKLMTYQRAITRRSVLLANSLSRGTLQFSAISRQMIAGVKDVGIWHIIYNGVDLRAYDFRSVVEHDAPLVFLGRIEHVKGTHLAIEVAQRTGVPLVIAGNVESEHRGYFNERVLPHIDGRMITYLGAIDDREKNALLGRARALLMPILWEEPFGIVMSEALACGTPVVALARGAVPEVVDAGVTGFVCSDVDDLVSAVRHIGEIDRASCRSRAERLFSGDAIVEGYLGAYREVCSTVFRGVA